MAPFKYGTPNALRTALESRLQQTARKEGIDLQRLRRQVAFDRLLARFFSRDDAPWALKGGYAMELRMAIARTTKDIDLTFIGNPSPSSRTPQGRNMAVLELLQTCAAIDIGDFFVYKIGEPTMDLTAPVSGGARYPVEAEMDNRLFAGFHLDVALGDVLIEPLEQIEGRDWLGFAGIGKVSLRAISAEQQFAEKLHAYLYRSAAHGNPYRILEHSVEAKGKRNKRGLQSIGGSEMSHKRLYVGCREASLPGRPQFFGVRESGFMLAVVGRRCPVGRNFSGCAANVPPAIDGVLGGMEHVHEIDIRESIPPFSPAQNREL